MVPAPLSFPLRAPEGRVARPERHGEATAASVTGIRGTRPSRARTSRACSTVGTRSPCRWSSAARFPSLRTPTDSRRESRGGSDSSCASAAGRCPLGSMGFRVANTRNGSGSACVVFPTVDALLLHGLEQGGCVLGGVGVTRRRGPGVEDGAGLEADATARATALASSS